MRNIKQGSQGSTLIMSVLILTSILASMYILADISLRNIRQNFALLNGERAVLAADAVTERALWHHFRGQVSAEGNCDTTPPTYKELAEELNASDSLQLEHCKSTLFANPHLFYIRRDDAATPGRENVREFFIIDRSVTPPSGADYSRAVFTWRGGSGTVKVCEWSNPDCSQSPWIAFGTLSSAGSVTANLTPGRKYVVRLESTGPNGFWVTGEGYDGSGNPKGLPSDIVIVRGRATDFFSSRTWEVELAP